MKKYFIITIVALLLSAVTMLVVSHDTKENLMMLMARSVEVFGKDDNNTDVSTPVIIVTCHCNALLGHTCRANHNGATCAGGENIQCSSYDGNC